MASTRSRAVLGTLALVVPLCVQADQADTFNLTAGAGVRHEDNLFRAPDIAGVPKRSDTASTVNAGLRIDKSYSMQRFQVDASATRYSYANNSFLDFTGVDYRAAWLWHLTPRISGTLSADRTEALVNFSDFRYTGATRPSTQINQRRAFTVDGWLGGAWHVVGGVFQMTSTNDSQFTEVGSYTQNGVEAGMRYVSRADNILTLVQRESTGDYEGRQLDLRLLDTGFKQSETEARLQWRLTGHSSIDARLGHLERRHDNFGQRDYSGMVGRFDYLWTPTGKLQIRASAARNLFSFQEFANSYYVADTLSLVPTWSLTAKSSLYARLDHTKRDYRGAVDSSAGPLREDTIKAAQLGANWQANRNIVVRAHLTHERRESTLANYDYKANIAGITGQIMF